MVRKSFEVRLQELKDSLEILAISLNLINDGKKSFLLVLAGQLRSLLVDKGKNNVPLFLDLANQKGEQIFCYGVLEQEQDVSMVLGGLRTCDWSGISLDSTAPAQKLYELKDFMEVEQIVLRKETTLSEEDLKNKFSLGELAMKDIQDRYSLKEIINVYANKHGGSHYDLKINNKLDRLRKIIIFAPDKAKSDFVEKVIFDCATKIIILIKKFIKEVEEVEEKR